MIKWILAGIAVVIVIIVFVVGIYQLNWFVQKSVTNHQNHITRYSYSYQTSQLEDADTKLTQIAAIDVQIQQQPQNKSALTSQKLALENSFCYDYHSLQTINVPSNIQAFATEACTTPAA